MSRPIWSGNVSFGLVTVPVKMLTASEQKDVHFRELQKGTGRRIHHKRVAEGTGREVDYEDVVKGYELHEGKYVELTKKDLEAVAPTKTHAINIEDFVGLEEIEPVFFEKSYYLAPGERGAAKAYALLLKAMAKSEKVAIGRFVMRSKQYLCAIRASDDHLVLHTLFFADEIREAPTVRLGKVRLTDRDLKMAAQLIDGLTTKWDPDRYEDTYREDVLKLIRRRAKGKEIEAVEEERPEVPTDLTEALKRSFETVKKAKSASKKRSTRRKSA